MCGNEEALFLTEDSTCNKCKDLVKKKPVKVSGQTGKKRGPYKKSRPRLRPMKLTGEYSGKVRYFRTVEATAEFLEIEKVSVYPLVRRGKPTSRIHWTVEHCSREEWDEHEATLA
jgi:hypothetical protein